MQSAPITTGPKASRKLETWKVVLSTHVTTWLVSRLCWEYSIWTEENILLLPQNILAEAPAQCSAGRHQRSSFILFFCTWIFIPAPFREPFIHSPSIFVLPLCVLGWCGLDVGNCIWEVAEITLSVGSCYHPLGKVYLVSSWNQVHKESRITLIHWGDWEAQSWPLTLWGLSLLDSQGGAGRGWSLRN